MTLHPPLRVGAVKEPFASTWWVPLETHLLSRSISFTINAAPPPRGVISTMKGEVHWYSTKALGDPRTTPRTELEGITFASHLSDSGMSLTISRQLMGDWNRNKRRMSMSQDVPRRLRGRQESRLSSEFGVTKVRVHKVAMS
jgi:hypothetical protein